MTDKNAKNFGYPSQLAIFLGSTGGGIIISVVASVLIWVLMEGTSIPHNTQEILQPKYYSVNMVLQGVSTFFIFFVPVVFFASVCYRKPFFYLGYNLHFNYKQVLLVILLLIITFPLAGSLGELNRIFPIPHNLAIRFKAWEDARAAEEAALININTLPKYFSSIFIIALLPAIFEETFFRAGMQNLFTRWFKGPWVALIITSIFFSLIHISYYGFLVRFALGMVLGLIFYYSGNLWLSILFHFLFNGLQVTLLFVTSNSRLLPHKEIEANFPLWVGLPAIIFLVYVFHQFIKFSAPEMAIIHADKADDDLYEWTRNQP